MANLLSYVKWELTRLWGAVKPERFRTREERELARWHSDEGDRALRLEYDLGEDSLVFDLGGYQGQWTSDIFAMYGCIVHVFEPVTSFAEQIRRRFARNRRITVHTFGLSAADAEVPITLDRDSTSAFKQGAHVEICRLVRGADFLAREGITKIDLMKINIEGGEYDLLEHLVESGAIRMVRHVQVQFHDFVPDAEVRLQRARELLARTHTPTWQYEFVWESWALAPRA